MKKQLLTLFLVCILNPVFAQLTENTAVRLLTLSPGDELYSNFGHSAIWIEDQSLSLSVVFNYGTFDFNTPNFYMKFTRGKLNYKLSAGSIRGMLYSAKRENRSLISQEMSLTVAQKNKLYDLLRINMKPENVFYQYDFFYDNCSTRIRDIFEDVLGEDLTWTREAEDKTFRNFIDIYLAEKHWQDFGIDLVLGQPTDKVMTKRDEMFLPDYLMYHFDAARVNGEPLVGSTETLFQAKEDKTESSFSLKPVHVTWFICLLGIFLSIQHHKRGWNDRIFDRVLFFLTGLIGCIIFFLWFLSDHIATVNNWNMAWAIPINVFMGFFLFHKPAKRWQTIYYAIMGTVCFLILGFFYTLPQQMHAAVLPIVLYLTFKCFNVLYRTKKLNVK
jgi:hypothetical protein